MPRNVAEFHIIGQIGSIHPYEKVTYVKVAANYNRKVDDEWKEYTRWNSVTCFGREAELAQKAGIGDMVRITGSPEQSSYERGEEIIYSTRSEEHTSELQSIMRISYAVFCLT